MLQMINTHLKEAIQKKLSEVLNVQLSIDNILREAGGDINDCFRLKATNGDYFLKLNDRKKYPSMFSAESKGLHLLRENSNFSIPEVIVEMEFEDHSLLILSYLSLSRLGDWEEFGRSLAIMHKTKRDFFGLDHDNYIGSIKQINSKHDSWSSFYRDERIIPLFKEAFDQGHFTKKDMMDIETLCNEFESFFPIESPALLHGDLWSGNAAFNKGIPCIYDPAVYFGHREMDLGMTHLFGGFPNEMYSAYNEVYPLENNWIDRLKITQLYPLLVHVLLFGASYASQVQNILRRS